MELTISEENYLKTIFHLSQDIDGPISTNEISDSIKTKAASVTDMIGRLARKKLINYKKYYGVTLTTEGARIAKQLVRRHRLWEVFLVDKLGYTWDNIHDIAEQMEHVQGIDLVERLDNFLGNPKVDPHGDPIPDAEGKIIQKPYRQLSNLKQGESGKVVGVKDSSPAFLQYLDSQRISLGTFVQVNQYFDFDGSMNIEADRKTKFTVSQRVAHNLLIEL